MKQSLFATDPALGNFSMAATIPDSLVEIGAAMPNVLDTLVAHDDLSTALECVRHAACTAAREALQGPPPALVHPSKIPSAHFLYSAEKPCPLNDAAYFRVTEPELLQVQDGACAGAVMVDACKGHCACPATVWTSEHEGVVTITIRVYNAPLASMEAELFHGPGRPSAFERRWLNEGARYAKDLRQQVGNHIRSRGFCEMPTWMHEGNYAIERPGVLPLLRMRACNTQQESESLNALLEYEHKPKQGFVHLKDIVSKGSMPVRVRTIFYAAQRASSELAMPEEECNCTPVQKHGVISSLALLVLKNLEDDNYWNVNVEADEDVEDSEDGGEEEEEERRQTGKLQRVIEDLQLKESTHAEKLDATPPALGYRGDNVLMMLTSVLRPCDCKVLVRSTVSQDQASAVFRAFLSESDALVMQNVLDTEPPPESTMQRLMFKLGTRLVPKQALLVITKRGDGLMQHAHLMSRSGEQLVPQESITRYVMCPWLTPVVVDADTVAELKVQGVLRKTLRLSESDRTSNIRDQRGRIPQPVLTFIEEASDGLKALPGLTQRIEAIEEFFKTSVLAQAPPPALVQVAPVPAAPAVVAAPAPMASSPLESEVSRGLKRTIELLEVYEATQSALD